MTAFARESSRGDEGELTWEVRSVNHRYLEAFLRLPEELRVLEPRVRELLARRLKRGKLDCALRYHAGPQQAGLLTVNRPLVQQLLVANAEIGELAGGSATPAPMDLLRWPGVLQEQERDLTPLMEEAVGLLDKALDNLIASRRREGERLGELLRQRCQQLQDKVAQVRARLPQVLEEIRRRIRDRLEEVVEELDPNRVEQEMVLLAQRLDVDEEMDRLDSHLAEVLQVLERNEPVGRRLDFIMQELNRETNTLTSKSNDVEITRIVVDMKVLIEQMREQVQNIE
jgi:uncharacterized protein (TIGR00255 family)